MTFTVSKAIGGTRFYACKADRGLITWRSLPDLGERYLIFRDAAEATDFAFRKTLKEGRMNQHYTYQIMNATEEQLR